MRLSCVRYFSAEKMERTARSCRGERTRPTERECEEHGDGNAHGIHRERVLNGIQPVEDMGQRERVQRPPSDGDSSHDVSSGSSGESGYCQPREGGGSDSMGTQEGVCTASDR